MVSLLQQMELLQKQQEILSEKIKAEQERQQKLNDESSIERLEELIKPITESLDFRRKTGLSHYELSSRQQLNRQYELLRINRISSHVHERLVNRPRNKFDLNKGPGPALACEEIFTTILNIIKN